MGALYYPTPNVVLDEGGSEAIKITGGTTVSPVATVTVVGNLDIQGALTSVQSTTLQVDDKNIELAVSDTPSDATADGGGITLKGTTDKTISWDYATAKWHFNQGLHIEGTVTINSGRMAVGYPAGTSVVKEFMVAGAALVANNHGFVQYDAAGNIGTVVNLDSNDRLNLGDVNHVDQLRLNVAGRSFNWPTVYGTNGQALLTDGAGNLSWGTVSSSGGGTYLAGSGLTLSSGNVFSINYSSHSETISSGTPDVVVSQTALFYLINVTTSGGTLTLPSATSFGAGTLITVKNISTTNAFTLKTNGGMLDSIAANVGTEIVSKEAVGLFCDGTNFHMV